MTILIEWFLFLALSAIAVITAAGMLLTMSMYRAGLALMASFLALAGLFILLDADLLAAIQVMMNVGGMLVMVLFMVMMMMDPGGEMMWDMKRKMNLPGPGAFSMAMPRKKPPEEKSQSREPQQKEPHDQEQQVYTCPMHTEVQQDHTGSCPKCGMELVAQEVAEQQQAGEQQSATYTCPMHAEVQQDQPGTCPKCGMQLVLKEEQQSLPPQQTKRYVCPMHAEVQQDQPGTCPKCGMELVEQEERQQNEQDRAEQHASSDQSGMDMSSHQGSSDQSGMNMSGMNPRQYYQMMVDMAMSTAQLPWALVLGALSALLLILLVSIAPWPQSHNVPTQDATTMVGNLLLSRYMIGFEGAAFLILTGIAGAVILGKRESLPAQKPEMPKHASEHEHEQEPQETIYTCPMHPEIRQPEAGSCPKCGMQLIPEQAAQPDKHAASHGGHP